MRIRSFIIAYALVLAILLFADRRHSPDQQDRYSHVVDLTTAPKSSAAGTADGQTRIVAPDALIPGTWTAGQIPPERLIAPLVVMDLNISPPDSQISLDDIAAWENQHGTVPQGSVVAIRRAGASAAQKTTAFPVSDPAAQFLMDARYTTGFVTESPADFSDRTLARQIALHGNYVVESTAKLSTLPATGSLIIVAPARKKDSGRAPVRVLAMVR
jgi:kynurenine formamidase